MGGEWVARGRREMKPLLLKVGVALFLSFAGFLYSHLRSRGDRRGRSSRDHHPPRASFGEGVEAGREAGGSLKEDFSHAHGERAPKNVHSGTTVTKVTSPTVGLSPGSTNSGDEGYLLPEFNELVLRQFESVGLDTDALEVPLTYRLVQGKGENVTDQEIIALKNLVHLLQERVASLEIQLLEYYGVEEQESTMRELENHLKINTVEAKLLSLKIESLQAENQRLGAQVSDFSRIKAELESARARIKHLERTLSSDSVEANEMVAELHKKLEVLQERECKCEEGDEEAEERLRDFEDEAAELRKTNSKLALENSDLAKRLSTQLLASSTLESSEATKALEVNNLREANDKLTKEIAQLQIDHCADVEELVYLRWINACLRYELRNYQPPTGKTVARDLSKTLSPDSELKAKQLILEYAHSGMMDFDLEYYSSSQASSTENGDADDSSVDANTATKSSSSSKTKFFRKLKRLVMGKDIHHNRISSVDRSPKSVDILGRRASVSTCSFDDIMDRNSYDGVVSCITSDNAPGNQLVALEGKVFERRQNEVPWTRNLSRVSLDFRRLKSQEELGERKGERSKSDVGASYWRTLGIGEESLLGSPHSSRADHETFDSREKPEMEKYAHISKSPRGKPNLHTRAASFSLF
uniref:Protein CHUP1, chloroplastic n=1 Tax=Anthurium amnicola TaxID=1678845 RepID=A0A1D1YBS5_9ARAE